MEMLVSLTIVSVIMLLIASGIKLVSTSWDRNLERVSHLEAYARLVTLFHRDIEGIRRILEKGDKVSFYAFSGTEKTLSFVTREPAYPSKPGFYNIQYSSPENSQDGSLLRTRRAYAGNYKDTASKPLKDGVSLLGNGYTYKFSYAVVRQNKITWQKQWKQSDKLPELVRLEINNPDRPATMPVIARVRINAELECIFSRGNQCSLGKPVGKQLKPLGQAR